MGITDKFGDMADKAKDALGANKDKVDDAQRENESETLSVKDLAVLIAPSACLF